MTSATCGVLSSNTQRAHRSIVTSCIIFSCAFTLAAFEILSGVIYYCSCGCDVFVVLLLLLLLCLFVFRQVYI